MTEETDSLIKRLLLDEVSGKNQAIHAYDRMIWTVRTGFLTLLFAGWGLLLSSLAKNTTSATDTESVVIAEPLLASLVAVSAALATAGFVIDLNYVRRKFRVIHSLNELMTVIIDHDESEITSAGFAATHLRGLLQVAGDSGSRDYLRVEGYKGGRMVSLVIYSIPLVGVAVAVALLAAGH